MLNNSLLYQKIYKVWSIPRFATQSPPAAQPILDTTLNMNHNTNLGRNFPAKKSVEFILILVSYANLLPYLLNNAMVSITQTKVPQPLFFWGYNSNATCAYHGGVSGHSIEHCMTLKHKVKSLIDAGWLKFEEDNRLWILTLASNAMHGTIWKLLLDVSNDSLGFSSLCHYCKQHSQC